MDILRSIFTVTNRVSVIRLRLHIYRTAIYIILEYFYCMTSPAEMCESGPWRPWSAEYCVSATGLRIFRRRKVAGATSSEP